MKTNAIQKTTPRGWIVKKMDDFIKEGVITLGRGEVISKTDIKNYPGENPIYSSSVKNNALFGTYAKHMFDEELITWSVDGGGDFFHRPKHKFSVTNVSGYMNADQNQFDYKFLAYYLQEEHSKKSFNYQNKAHPSVIRELYEIAKPPIKEQRKIAEILGTVDEDIAKTQEVIEATEKLKRGLMQQLFTRGIEHTKLKETKIGQIPEEWKITKLGSVGDVITGNTPKTSEKSNYGGDYLLVSPKDIGSKKYINDSENRLSQKGYGSTRKISKGSVLVVCIGSTIGKIALAGRELSTNQQINSVVVNSNYSNEFIYYQLLYRRQDIIGRRSTQAVPIINKTDFSKTELAVPKTKKEQQEIAEILSAVDEKVSINEKFKAKLTILKKGLMQDLLSGKVRVI